MIHVLLDSLWQGAFVVAIAAGITALVPQRHAATRYAVWFAALIALALLPFSAELSFGAPVSAIPSSVIRTTSIASHVTERAADTSGVWFAAAWGAGVLFCLMRLALSCLRIARIRRTAVPAPHLGERVFTSTLISIPIVAGFRPVVIVPRDLSETLDRVDLDSIIAHERAHIRRRDIPGNFLQRLLESLLFFNPWIYVIGFQLLKEREAACDDWAVHAVPDPDRYASCLANMALWNPGAHAPLLTPGAMGSSRMLIGRIARLLNGRAQMKTNRVVVAAAVALFVLLGITFQTHGLAAAGGSVAATNTKLPAKCWSEPMMLHAVPPDIPDSVAVRYPSVVATLKVTVTAGGHASDITLVKSSGNQTIDTAAAEAARQSTYKPEMRNCKPVSGGLYLFQIRV